MSDKPMSDKITYYWWTITRWFAAAFRRMLDDDQTLEVVGEASNGAEAVKLAKNCTRKSSLWIVRCPN